MSSPANVLDQQKLQAILESFRDEIFYLKNRNHELQQQIQVQNSNYRHLDPKVKLPQLFSGSPSELRGFVNDISLVFERQPRTYPSNDPRSRELLVGSLLTGSAKRWWNPIYESL